MSNNDDVVKMLVALFDGCAPEDLVRDVLHDCKGNQAAAITQLEEMTGMSARRNDDEGMGDGQPSTESGGMGSQQQSSFVEVDYDEALATGEEKEELERAKQLNDLIKHKVDDIALLAAKDRQFQAEAERQKKIGAQSLRSHSIDTSQGAGGNKYFKKCFDEMLANEERHAGEFVCFYHSYSLAALIYEIQGCIARTAYGLDDNFAPLPRLLKGPFLDKPHMNVLLNQFKSMGGQDHDPSFRAVAISVSVSLDAPGSEAPPMGCFAAGYSCNDLSFAGVVTKIFQDLGCSKSTADTLLKRCVDVASKYGLHSSSYGSSGQGAYCTGGQTGHMLQIFVRKDCVDDVAYGCHAYGVYDPPRNPLSEYLLRKKAPDGQARIFWHPSLFCDTTKTKLYHYCADEKFAQRRQSFQNDLLGALSPLFGTPKEALQTFYHLEGKKQ